MTIMNTVNPSLMSYMNENYMYEMQGDYSTGEVTGNVTMTLQQFQELQSGFDQRVEAIVERKIKEMFGDD
jgi:hypothetical protein